MCGFPAGSGADVLVRYMAEKVRPIANRTIIVENKVGAAGNIAAEYTVRSKPDGHTVYVHAASAIAANMHLFKKPPIDAARDLQIAAGVNKQPFMVMVPAEQPVQDVGRADRGDEEKGREGELCAVEYQRQGDGRAVQAGDRRQGRGRALPNRQRQLERFFQRRPRLRDDGPGVRAEPGARARAARDLAAEDHHRRLAGAGRQPVLHRDAARHPRPRPGARLGGGDGLGQRGQAQTDQRRTGPGGARRQGHPDFADRRGRRERRL